MAVGAAVCANAAKPTSASELPGGPRIAATCAATFERCHAVAVPMPVRGARVEVACGWLLQRMVASFHASVLALLVLAARSETDVVPGAMLVPDRFKLASV